jgi:protein translocase SecG subunit
MVLMQDSKRGMSQTLAGGSSDNFYQKNSGRSKEAQLARATRTAAILFFVVTLVVNVFAIYFRGGTDETPAPETETELELVIGEDGEIDWDATFQDMGDYAAYDGDGEFGDEHEIPNLDPDTDPVP